ncbi:MAG: hypothetical protein ACP5C3_07075 [Methanomicrobiales archaeon]
MKLNITKLNKYHFMIIAVKTKLRATKVIKVRDIDYNTAKNEVLGYYQSYQEAYDYEVAQDLEIDYELVCEITEELEREGRLGIIK